MSGDTYNVKKSVSVGPNAKNIVHNRPGQPDPPEPPTSSSWMTIASVAVAASLTVSGGVYFLGQSSPEEEAGSTEIEIVEHLALPPVIQTASAETKSASGPRLALVIAQTDYTAGQTDIALAEAEAAQIETALRSTGFVTTSARNLTRAGLADTLDSFRSKLEAAGSNAIGFVYYTGHGTQHPKSGDSYLLGTDARLNTASDLPLYGLNMQSQSDAFAATDAKAVFLVFDACRNVIDPGGWKAGTKGISRVEAMTDMLIAYSTSANDVAEEGVYAPILAEELSRAGQTAETAFATTQRRVADATGREQLPYTSNKLYSEICFLSCPSEATTGGAVTPP
jgi:hypothetical protein